MNQRTCNTSGTKKHACGNCLWRKVAPGVVALGLLIGIGAEAINRPTASDADPYHAAVLEAVANVPDEIAGWRYRSYELREEEIELLKPNAVLYRRYVNEETGEWATVLMVQTRNAEDMSGHYPPNCYPTQGWSYIGEPSAKSWTVAGLDMQGMEYHFEREYRNQDGDLRVRRSAVVDFLIMPRPENSFVRTMDEVNQAAGDYTRFHYGVTHLQVITDVRMTDERRREVVDELLTPCMGLIATVRNPDADQAISAPELEPEPKPATPGDATDDEPSESATHDHEHDHNHEHPDD